MTVNITGWAMFWLFLIVLVAADVAFIRMGLDGFFFEFKSPAEKQLQQVIIAERRNKTRKPCQTQT